MIQAFKDKDLFSLVKQMNDFSKNHEVFATNIFPSSPWSKDWGAVAFYEVDTTIPADKPETSQIKQNNEKPIEYYKKEEKPQQKANNQQSKPIKYASIKQINLMNKLKIQIPKNCTSYQASKLIEEKIKKEDI